MAEEVVQLPKEVIKLSEARGHLKPKVIEDSLFASAGNGDFWRQPPHPHEEYLVAAYVGLAEKKLKGELFTIEDARDAATILEYIASLSKEQVTTGQPVSRSISPVLVQANLKAEIHQSLGLLDQLEKPKFFELYPDRPYWSLRHYVHRLSDAKLINLDVDRLDQKVGSNLSSQASRNKPGAGSV